MSNDYAIKSRRAGSRSWKSGFRIDMMLLLTGASASSQLPGKLDELSDHRKKARDEQDNCALTSRGKTEK
jgi:hypothetical protein